MTNKIAGKRSQPSPDRGTCIYHSSIELERDLELERRKVREVHEASRERDKEYQKLKANVVIPSPLRNVFTILQAQHDKIKRKALLAPDSGGGPQGNIGFPGAEGYSRHLPQNPNSNQPLNVGAVVGDMQANGVENLN